MLSMRYLFGSFMKKGISSRWKVSISPSGQPRVGGRIVSKRQFGAVLGWKKRRGEPINIEVSDQSTAASRRSDRSKKSSLTRQLNNQGVFFERQWRTPRAGFLRRSWTVEPGTELTKDLVELIIERESVGIGREQVLAYLFADIQDRNNDNQRVGTKLKSGIFDDMEEQISKEMKKKLDGYGVVAVNKQATVLGFSANATSVVLGFSRKVSR